MLSRIPPATTKNYVVPITPVLIKTWQLVKTLFKAVNGNQVAAALIYFINLIIAKTRNAT
jgi:hypothetical protein